MVTQAEAINTAMIGHQISPLSQQIIAVSVVCSGGGEKNQFHCPKACNKAPSARASCFFSGTRGRSGQTCNFWNSLPAAYFFLCQLLAAGSACGPRDLTKVACGAKTGQRSALNVLPKKTTVGKETVSVAIWRAERTGRLVLQCKKNVRLWQAFETQYHLDLGGLGQISIVSIWMLVLAR